MIMGRYLKTLINRMLMLINFNHKRLKTNVVSIGDYVMLNSGGPKMRIQSINGDDVYCSWETKDKYIRAAKFSIKMLAQLTTRN